MDIKKTFYKYLENGAFYHVLFWFVFYLLLIIMIGQHSDKPLIHTIGNQLVRVFFFMVIVYFNLLFLFPRYLKENKFYLYTALLAVAVVLITPLESFIHYYFFSGDLPLSQINKSIFLGGFFMGFSSTLFKIISDWASHQKEKNELQRQSLQSELNFLKSQINPHFLFNTLNSLYALTLKKSDQAPEIVLRLSEMMRYMLYECNEPKVSLSKEINYVKNYLELEKLRHGEKSQIDMNIEGNVNGQKITPLLFIPFLENSFKHGMDQQLGGGYVKIDLKIAGDQLNLNVENDKSKEIAIIPSKKKSGGIGLVNVKRRLELLYPKKHDLLIENKEDKFKVNLNVNLS